MPRSLARGGRRLVTALALLLGVAPLGASTMVPFCQSIVPLAESGGRGAHVVRARLTAAELDASAEFKLPLAFRNFGELQARVARGERISHAEMLARYYPTPAAYRAVAHWARGQGFDVAPQTSLPLVVTVRGRVQAIARSLHTQFERVAGADGTEYSSAVTAPELPAAIAPAVRAIVGLQPQWTKRALQAVPVITTGARGFTPAMMREYYQATGYDGAGQVIAIIGLAPDLRDVAGFWAKCGIAQSLGNITIVNRGWTQPSNSGATVEWTGDVEWASGMAPAAKIRIYDTVDPYQFVPALLEDMQVIPGLRQASMSVALTEAQRSPDGTRAESQLYAALAAEGMTFFVSSGDGGSNPDPHASFGGDYTPSAPLSVEYPASDPCIVAVGGTQLSFDPQTWAVTGEVSFGAYDQNGALLAGSGASGGGLSALFARPAWQAGPGVPVTSMRCVPDVAAAWGGNLPAYAFYDGTDTSFGGTSLSSPLWAGLCALLNQARAAAGEPSLGLLGPRIYPLIGTSAFKDVVGGSNGAYNAGAGYDLCTGVGTPNIATLATALVQQGEPAPVSFPAVTRQPQTQVVAPGGTVTFTVGASSTEAVSYQWIEVAASNSLVGNIDDAPWTTLADDTTYSGTQTAALTIKNAPATLDGALFACRVINSYGVAITAPAVLGVSSTATAIAPRVVNFSNPEVLPGQPATMSVDAVGTAPMSFQWLDGYGNPIPGATNSSLTLATVRPEDSQAFVVRVSNAAGSVQQAAGVTVLSNPTLMTPPTIAATVGESFSYQLRAPDNGGVDFTTQYGVTGLPPGLSLDAARGLVSGVPSQQGSFALTITASNELGSDSVAATLVVNPPGPPKIVAPPASVSMGLPTDMPPMRARFEVAATGGNLRYQWLCNGVAIQDDISHHGTNTAQLEVEGRNYLAGRYSVQVTNDLGSATSDAATFTVGSAPSVIIPPPHQQTVIAGSSVWLNVNAEGDGRAYTDGLSYQWRLDGTSIPGATARSLHLARVGKDQAGTYTVDVTYGGKTVSSADSRVEVLSDSRPINLSSRAWVGAGDEALFAGFAITGSAPKKVLLRAAGPALAAFGVTGFVADPRIELHDSENQVVAANDDWSADPASADAIEQAAAAAGAFGFARGSKDAALLVTLPPGVYSAVVTGANGTTGIAIAEVYDAEPTDHRSTLTNISSRAFVQPGDKTMIVGFVIDGTQPRTVLVRAAGPALAPFGVPALLPDPSFEVRPTSDAGVVVGGNDDWSADPAAAMAIGIANGRTNAFGWATGSKDAAAVLTLDPGGYSIVVHDATGSSGNALVEVYDVP